jgi:hypothetical protein
MIFSRNPRPIGFKGIDKTPVIVFANKLGSSKQLLSSFGTILPHFLNQRSASSCLQELYYTKQACLEQADVLILQYWFIQTMKCSCYRPFDELISKFFCVNEICTNSFVNFHQRSHIFGTVHGLFLEVHEWFLNGATLPQWPFFISQHSEWTFLKAMRRGFCWYMEKVSQHASYFSGSYPHWSSLCE